MFGHFQQTTQLTKAWCNAPEAATNEKMHMVPSRGRIILSYILNEQRNHWGNGETYW